MLNRIIIIVELIIAIVATAVVTSAMANGIQINTCQYINWNSSYNTFLVDNEGNITNANARTFTYTAPNANTYTSSVSIQTLSDGRANNSASVIKIVTVGDIGNNSTNLSLLANKINELAPDYVLLLGDFIYGVNNSTTIDNFVNALNLPSNRVIAVIGNHDSYTSSAEGGTAKPASTALEAELLKKLNINYTSNKVIKIENVAILTMTSSGRGAPSGVMSTTYSGPNTTYEPITYISKQYQFLRYWSSIIKQDPSAEWKILATHYPFLGYSSGGAGRDRNDYRWLFGSYLIKGTNDLEGFDLTIHGHIHQFGRSVEWKPNTTLSLLAEVVNNTSANYNNGGSTDFTDSNHGLITLINGLGGKSTQADILFDYTSTYTGGVNLNGRSGVPSTTVVGLTLLTIQNQKNPAKTSLKMDSYTYDGSAWSLYDSFTINKNRRYAGDMQITQYLIGNSINNNPNIYDWRYGNEKVYTAVLSENFTASFWVKIEDADLQQNGTTAPLADKNVKAGWNQTTGESTVATVAIPQAIIWQGDARYEGVNAPDTVNSIGINVSTTNRGKLNFVTENQAGTNLELISTATINNGVWHNVVVVKTDSVNNGGNEKVDIYVDGVASGSTTYTGDFVNDPETTTTNTVLSIGFDYSGSRVFKGQLSNVAVWNTALTSADITALYTNPNTASILSSAVVRAYFPPNNTYADTPALNEITTLEDKTTLTYNNNNNPSYKNINYLAQGEVKNITPPWRYADSGILILMLGWLPFAYATFADDLCQSINLIIVIIPIAVIVVLTTYLYVLRREEK